VELGSAYGAMPAHDGLWESATTTAHSLPARLAVEACVHEARGLDVLPQTIARCFHAPAGCTPMALRPAGVTDLGATALPVALPISEATVTVCAHSKDCDTVCSAHAAFVRLRAQNSGKQACLVKSTTSCRPWRSGT